VWEHSFVNKLGRLFQGIRNIPGTDTCFFIRKAQVPKHKRATYSQIVCNVRPQKDEIYCTQLTVGGNLINFPGNKSTSTADLLTAKLLINSTISTPGAVFLGIDLASFYLKTPMPEPEYMCLCLDIIPKGSSKNTTYATWSTKKDGSTLKSGRECTACPKPASLPTNSSNNASLLPKDITSANTLWVSGTMSGAALFSALSSTILE
jgi:hypothetical protein